MEPVKESLGIFLIILCDFGLAMQQNGDTVSCICPAFFAFIITVRLLCHIEVRPVCSVNHVHHFTQRTILN